MRAGGSEQSNTASLATEAGGDKARSAPAMFAPPICRRSRRNRREQRKFFKESRFVGLDEDGGFPRTSQRAERAIKQSELGEASNTNERGNQTR